MTSSEEFALIRHRQTTPFRTVPVPRSQAAPARIGGDHLAALRRAGAFLCVSTILIAAMAAAGRTSGSLGNGHVLREHPAAMVGADPRLFRSPAAQP